MKRFALPLAAALLLTGCTAGSPSAAPSTPADTQEAATPTATPTPAKTADPRQAWADEKIVEWLGPNKPINREVPFHYIESWDSPEPGTLTMYVPSGYVNNDELEFMAEQIYNEAPLGSDIEAVQVVELNTWNRAEFPEPDQSETSQL